MRRGASAASAVKWSPCVQHLVTLVADESPLRLPPVLPLLLPSTLVSPYPTLTPSALPDPSLPHPDQAAKEVVLAQKPVITDDTGALDPLLLDKLLRQIATLASIYHKPPEMFVSRQRLAVQRAADLEVAGEGGSGRWSVSGHMGRAKT